MRCRKYLKIVSNGLFFFERCSLLTSIVCANKHAIHFVCKHRRLSVPIIFVESVDNLYLLKAQVSFSDPLSSVVCPSVRLSVGKIFTMPCSSPEPLSQSIKLGTNYSFVKGIQVFIQMKYNALSQKGIIWK